MADRRPPATAAGAPPAAPRLSWNQAYHEELAHLRPWLCQPPPAGSLGAAAPRPRWAVRDAAEHVVAAPYAAGPGDDAETWARDKTERAANLQRLYTRVARLGDGRAPHDAPLTALCLSGGGIRSATFNLGVLQALARRGLLGQFDYLSTVSGGGYIGGWLTAWMKREGPRRVALQLRDPTWRRQGRVFNPLAPEPNAIDRLREHSNYLTPRLGLLSADTWAAAATALRNLLLNWLVLVPLLAAAVAVPQLALLVASLTPSSEAAGWMATLSLGCALWASWTVHADRLASLSGRGGRSEEAILRRGVLPIVLAALLLTLAAQQPTWIPVWGGEPRDGRALGWIAAYALLWCLVVPLVGWAFHHPPRRGWEELRALVTSGAITSAVLVALAVALRPVLAPHPPLYVAIAFPLLLCDYLLARALFAGLASRREGSDPIVDVEGLQGMTAAMTAAPGSGAGAIPATPPGGVPGSSAPSAGAPTAGAAARDRETGDFGTPIAPDETMRAEHDREWWARLSGWVLAIAVSWCVVTLLCTLGGWLLELARDRFVGPFVAAAGGISGVAAALLGRSGGTASAQSGAGGGSRWRERALAVAAPLFVAFLIIAVARVNTALGVVATTLFEDVARAAHLVFPATAGLPTRPWFTANPDLLHVTRDLRLLPRVPFVAAAGSAMLDDLIAFCAVPLAMLGVSAFFSYAVNPNRFSLHGFYRNRLVRAYLGASHERRFPDLFTGFAVRDDERLHQCIRPGATAEERGPLHIVNTALNVVQGERLAWQQRKAESFSMTPLHCGNMYLGYRSTRHYGGPGGITLGSAIAISGAAANPNMGYHSAPVVTFLMTLFNARLGAWLGNPGHAGNATYWHAGPRWAAGPLVAELFGRTNNQHPYVNLSDGGHFDNLGLYEIVLRRCRVVMVSDVGCDPHAGFEDLGNAIRKIRIDFGVPIVFERRMRIFARPDDAKSDRPGTASAGVTPLWCAVARIDYGAVDRNADGTPAPPGWLFYVKPQLEATGQPVPLDVYAYARGSQPFPHEPTSDQFFDEAQFESYRALGEHVVGEVLDGGHPAGRRAGTGAADAPWWDDVGLRELVERYLDRHAAVASGSRAGRPGVAEPPEGMAGVPRGDALADRRGPDRRGSANGAGAGD